MSRVIPIFFTFDNNYTILAAIAFYSLLKKANKDIFYKMHVLHRNITTENQNIIRNSLTDFDNFELSFTEVPNFIEESWAHGNWGNNFKNTRFTYETLFRCFAAKFFPQYDKIIYSDVDIVFADDISSLYDTELNDKYIAAVKDPFSNYQKFTSTSHLRIDHYEKLKDTWFAGGIWVMNLKKIREDNLEQKMINIIKDDTIEKRWYDMDVMNIACENKVQYIPLNYICYPFLLEHLEQVAKDSSYSREELYDSLMNPKIIHYAGIKPWQDRDMSFAVEWWTIFNYLKLPKTPMFVDKSRATDMKRKYKKCKKLLICTIAMFVIFLILALICLV